MEKFQELLIIRPEQRSKSEAIENELEGNKQNSRLLWRALKKLSPNGKVKSMPNDEGFSRSSKSI